MIDYGEDHAFSDSFRVSFFSLTFESGYQRAPTDKRLGRNHSAGGNFGLNSLRKFCVDCPSRKNEQASKNGTTDASRVIFGINGDKAQT